MGKKDEYKKTLNFSVSMFHDEAIKDDQTEIVTLMMKAVT